MRTALLALLVLAPARGADPPAVVIVCASGGIHRGDGAIATGGNCVIHDKNGAATAQALVIYDAGASVP